MVTKKTIVLDSKSHQAVRHCGTESKYYLSIHNVGKWKDIRLSGLVADLRNADYFLKISEPNQKVLQEACVFVVSGRSNAIPYLDEELSAILDYYKHGGSIFLMANHGGFEAPQNQIAIALSLPVEFHQDTVTLIKPRIVYPDHPTSSSCTDGLKFRTMCTMSVTSDSCLPVVINDEGNSVIATVVENLHSQEGRAFITTSAGHISSMDDSGADLYGAKCNSTWTMNIIHWLSEKKESSSLDNGAGVI